MIHLHEPLYSHQVGYYDITVAVCNLGSSSIHFAYCWRWVPKYRRTEGANSRRAFVKDRPLH